MTSKRLISSCLLLAGCGAAPDRSPPPYVTFEALPVSGSLADARRAGFVDCIERSSRSMRCSRHGVTLEGAGPYEAAVDLVGQDGSGGFDEVTLWHDEDQYALFAVTKALDTKTGRTAARERTKRVTRSSIPMRRNMC